MIDYNKIRRIIVDQVASNPDFCRGETDLEQKIKVHHVDSEFDYLQIPKRYFGKIKCPFCGAPLVNVLWFKFLKYSSLPYADMKCQGCLKTVYVSWT
ncbi:MAG: hypothetical protein ACTSQI_13865 [Candidatus Helarchaeota archaeon]